MVPSIIDVWGYDREFWVVLSIIGIIIDVWGYDREFCSSSSDRTFIKLKN